MLEERPDLEVIIVPVGGGSGAAGACIVASAVNPDIRVIGVQSERSPAAYESWRQGSKGRMVEAPNRTFAEGLATGTAFSLPQAILRERLKEFVLVSDEEILRAMRWMLERAHTLAEGAGAAPLAAAYRLRDTLMGKRVGIVCSGGNASIEQLRLALQDEAPALQ
jgi:threonine dehydratase